MYLIHYHNNPAWRANTAATRTAWMQCSTWTDVANDRNLWNTTVDAYLGSIESRGASADAV